jgi:hypothetical protein
MYTDRGDILPNQTPLHWSRNHISIFVTVTVKANKETFSRISEVFV